MTDKALSNLTQGTADTGDLLYAVVGGNSRKIPVGGVVSATVATQAEAEAGTSNTKFMSPLRSKQAEQARLDVFAPEDYGATGDGVADNEAAMLATFNAIVAAGGGEIWLEPNATYRYDLSGTGFVVDTIADLGGLRINGRAATLDYDIAFADDVGAWSYIFDNCDLLTIENVNSTAEDGHGTNGQPRGIRHWLVRRGGNQSIFRNLNMTGGIIGVHVDGVDVSSPNNLPNHQTIVENCATDGTFYGVNLQGGNNCIVKNLRTLGAGRSLYISDVDGLDASVHNIDHTHNDVVLQCNTDTSSSGLGKRLANVRLDYTCRVSAGEESGACINMGINTTTAAPEAVAISNIDIRLDIDGSGGDGVAGVFTFDKLKDGVADSTARSHVVDGLHIHGRAIDITQGGGVIFDSNMKSGDVFRRVEIGPFYMRKKSGAPDSDIVIDGAAFTTPLVLHDIDIDGDLTVTNFAAGMLDIRNCSFANFSTQANVGTSGFNKVTWGADSVNPALGNGTLTSRYVRDGKLVTWSLSLTMGNTTTFGTGNWFFSLQSPFAEAPRHKAICAWRGLDSGTTVLSGTGEIGTDGKVRLYVHNNGGTFTATNPITWATSDEIHLTVTYEV